MHGTTIKSLFVVSYFYCSPFAISADDVPLHVYVLDYRQYTIDLC